MDAPRDPAAPLLRPAYVLAQAGAALLALFLLWSLLPVLPPERLGPRWYLLAATSLVDNSPLGVLAVCLLTGAALLKPADRGLQALRATVARLLLPAVLGYLLLIPLAIQATAWQLQRLDQEKTTNISSLRSTTQNTLRMIAEAKDLASLDAGLKRLQGPSLSISDRSLPLAALKHELNRQLDETFSTMQKRIEAAAPGLTIGMARELLRVTLSSLVAAVALACLAYDAETGVNLFDRAILLPCLSLLTRRRARDHEADAS